MHVVHQAVYEPHTRAHNHSDKINKNCKCCHLHQQSADTSRYTLEDRRFDDQEMFRKIKRALRQMNINITVPHSRVETISWTCPEVPSNLDNQTIIVQDQEMVRVIKTSRIERNFHNHDCDIQTIIVQDQEMFRVIKTSRIERNFHNHDCDIQTIIVQDQEMFRLIKTSRIERNFYMIVI